MRSAFWILVLVSAAAGAVGLSQMGKGDMVLWLDLNGNWLFDRYFENITYLGSGIFFAAVILGSLFIRYYYTLLGASIGFTALITSWVLKNLLFSEALRPKPWLEASGFDISTLHFIPGLQIHDSLSFPSGHSVAAFALFGFLSIIYSRFTTSLVYFGLAASVALSRMYLKQHFLEDVYAGMIIGSLICFGIWKLFGRLGLAAKPWADHSILNRGS